MNNHAESFTKLFTNLPNYMMASEDPSTPILLQVLLSLSTDITKDSYKHIGGNMGELPYLKNRTAAAAIVRKWGKRIWVMGRYAYISLKYIVL